MVVHRQDVTTTVATIDQVLRAYRRSAVFFNFCYNGAWDCHLILNRRFKTDAYETSEKNPPNLKRVKSAAMRTFLPSKKRLGLMAIWIVVLVFLHQCQNASENPVASSDCLGREAASEGVTVEIPCEWSGDADFTVGSIEIAN